MSSQIEQLAADTARKLSELRLKLVTAESCTGGGLAFYLTELAGSSEWFERGFVTYSNLSKQDALNVQAETLRLHGAVSEATVKQMAEGALEASVANISIAITGIAGPSGGTTQKPVGTVWFGFASKTFATQTVSQLFSGNRQEIRKQAICFSLSKLLKLI